MRMLTAAPGRMIWYRKCEFSPVIPHSPNLSAYEFASDSTPATEIIGEYQTENVEWLTNDDAVSVTSSVGTSSGLNAAAPEFSSMAAQQIDMSPYDMLRSILGATRTDEEIEAALAMHGYDLSATIVSIMESQSQEGGGVSLLAPDEPRNVLVGKSVAAEGRPSTPVGQSKSSIICKFYMSTGQCLRADCRFSHDLSNHICKCVYPPLHSPKIAYICMTSFSMRMLTMDTDTGSWELALLVILAYSRMIQPSLLASSRWMALARPLPRKALVACSSKTSMRFLRCKEPPSRLGASLVAPVF
jgi:hypothetical protein